MEKLWSLARDTDDRTSVEDRAQRQVMIHSVRCAEPPNNDRHRFTGFASARIHPRVAQSVASLRITYRLDRLDRRLFFQKSSRSAGNISARPHQLHLCVAGL